MATKKKTKEVEIGSAFDLLGKSWELVKKNWQMFVIVNIAALLAAIGQLFNNDTSNKYYGFWSATPMFDGKDSFNWDLGIPWGYALAIGLFVAFIFFFVFTMSTKLELAASKGKQPGFQELIDAGMKYWSRMFLLLLASAAIILVGLILLIVPGIIAIGRLIFAPYVLIDKDLGVIDTMKESSRLAKGRASYVWAAIGVTFMVALAAAIIGEIPMIGALVATGIAIVYSLIIPLRYLEVKKIAKK